MVYLSSEDFPAVSFSSTSRCTVFLPLSGRKTFHRRQQSDGGNDATEIASEQNVVFPVTTGELLVNLRVTKTQNFRINLRSFKIFTEENMSHISYQMIRKFEWGPWLLKSVYNGYSCLRNDSSDVLFLVILFVG